MSLHERLPRSGCLISNQSPIAPLREQLHPSRYAIGLTTAAEETRESHTDQRRRARRMMSQIPEDVLGQLSKPVQVFVRAYRKALGEVMPLGIEPGLQPDYVFASLVYANITAKCKIKILEYSTLGTRESRVLNNEQLLSYLETRRLRTNLWNDHTGLWDKNIPAKAKVTWLNICGISWDVIKELQKRFFIHLHPLQKIMDAHNPDNWPLFSSADYYAEHLFLCAVRQKLEGKSDDISYVERIARSMMKSQDMLSDGDQNMDSAKRTTYSEAFRSSHFAKILKALNISDSDADKYGRQAYEVPVRGEPMFILLNRELDTVISICPSDDIYFASPIAYRLRTKHWSTLRRESDPSLLIQSLLDLIVGEITGVVGVFSQHIREIESQLIDWQTPTLKKSTLKRIHLLARELTMTTVSFRSIRDLIENICDNDAARFKRLPPFDQMRGVSTASTEPTQRDEAILSHTVNQAIKPPHEGRGYFTVDTKTHLKDVRARIEELINQMEKYHDISENLSNYAFNAKAYEINEIMRVLTIASVIFLPLSIMTAYFGMNFQNMSTERHTESFFWIVAIPVMAILFPLFLAGELGWTTWSFGRRGAVKRRDSVGQGLLKSIEPFKIGIERTRDAVVDAFSPRLQGRRQKRSVVTEA